MSEELIEQLEEMGRNNAALMAENEILTNLLTNDHSLTGLIVAMKNMHKEIEALRERNSGLMEEKNAAIRAAKSALKRAAA